MFGILRAFRVLQPFMWIGGTYTPPVPPPEDCPMAWGSMCLQWEDEQVTWS
jgi:hypothetical protein